MTAIRSPKGMRITIALAYLFMTVFNITFLSIIITDNQVELLSENTRYRSQEMLNRTASALRRYTQGFSGKGILNAHDTAERIGLINAVLTPLLPQYAIVDAQGKAVYSSDSNSALPDDFTVHAKKAITMREFTGADYYLSADPLSNRIDFYMPLRDAGISDMTLFIRNDITAMRERFLFLYRIIIVMASAVIIVHILMAAYVYRLVFTPLSRLLAGTKSVASGSYNITIPVKRMDELGVVSESFNRMSSEVGAAVDKLKKAAAIYQRDLAMAVTVQRRIFAAEPPAVDGYDIAFHFRPQSGISGDFYDFFTNGKKLEGVLIADVSGHGIASALLTTLAKPVFHRIFRLGSASTLANIGIAVNDALSEAIGDADNYLTAVLVRFLADGRIEYMNAGHTTPIVCRANGASALSGDELAQGAPLAFKDMQDMFRKTLRPAAFTLSPDDALILFTDCLVETKNTAGNVWSAEQAANYAHTLPRSASAAEIIAAVTAEFDAHTGTAPVKDDLTIIVIKRT